MKRRHCGLAVLIFGLGLSGQARGQYAFTPIDLPGAKQTFAFGMNDTGQVVGSYNFGGSGPNHGFLLSDCQYSTIDVPGATTTEAFGINNASQIVGWYYDADGKLRGFVATPQ